MISQPIVYNLPNSNIATTTLNPAFAPIFKKALLAELCNEFQLEETFIDKIIDINSSNWINNSLLYDITNKPTANQLLAHYSPIYRLLLRISLLKKWLGLSDALLNLPLQQNLPSGLLSGWPISNIPVFYFFENNYTSTNISTSIIWLQRMVEHSKLLGIPQEIFLQFTNDVFVYYLTSSNVNDASLSTLINSIYSTIPSTNVHKKISFIEFDGIYKTAKSLVLRSDYIIDVMDSFFELYSSTQIIGVSISNADFWVTNFEASFIDIKRVLKARFNDADSWYKFITPIHNGLRMRLRDALVAYYIGQKGFENSNAIYAHYLLDTEMEPCMKTSRIVQAISSVQLLIHRGLMGLEPQMCMDEDDKKEWEWRKNYRVWEANRKVFLYPENWIEPSLLLDKTPFFKELEDILAQDEINTTNAEKAFSNYLGNLNNVARLDIRGTYVEELENNGSPLFLGIESGPQTGITTLGKESKSILHVIGRTWNPPYTYFYRKSEKNIWTAWEKIELDIEGNHLIPMMFNRRLYLFWPLFIEKEHRTIKRTINGEEQNAPYFEIKMCYSKLEFGKWSSKKILDGSIYAGQYCGPGVYKNLERKLGTGITPPTKTIVTNPNWDISRWDNTAIGRNIFDWPNEFAPYGPFKEVWIPSNETLRGNLVSDNNKFQDYSFVSLDKNDFYFWAEAQDNGNMIIHTRRRFDKSWNDKHISYTEFAYEDAFLINNCNDKLEIIPPQVKEERENEKRFLSRPWLTVPIAQQMKKGLDGFDTLRSDLDGLYTKWNKSYEGDAGNGERFLKKTHSDYILTYPQQYPHNLWNQPFFYSDKQNTFFVHLYGVQIFWDINIIKSLGTFQDFQHPYACMMTAELNKIGLDGLLNAKNNELERQQALNAVQYFPAKYESDYTFDATPRKEFDFTLSGAYSIYNWEIFFHTVSLIARQLRQNNKFAEAIRWLQFVFDPTNRESEYGNLRYWKIKPFMKDVTEGSIQKLMQMLSGTSTDPIEVEKREELKKQIEEWRDHPFDPHKIASMRNRAYMLWTVMEYIETLTDWADSLFRQFTMESVNEAINLYVLASELLGKRPQQIEKAKSTDISFNDIENNLDAFSNTAVAIETIMGLDDHMPLNGPGYGLPELVFCIPENPKLKEIWDKVEDRLFKIRHCMNIDGKKVELALFQPPIDPALLVRAKAMGMDLADVLSDLAAPPPHYRFSFLLQKATDFCNEVKSLGGQLLSAIEKKDSEEIAQIRQVHEQNILKAARNIKKLQIDDAKNNYASLQNSKKLIEIRLNDYSNREFTSSKEEKTISLTKKAEGFMYAEQGAHLVSAIAAIFPDAYLGPTPLLHVAGGDKLARVAGAVGTGFGVISSVFRNMASMSSTYAGYDRRQEDWNLQIKTATEELNQMEKQLLGAEIRIAITEKELDNHDLQVEQSKEMYDHLKSKFSNLQLYTWMSGELMKLYRQSYELAYDMAKQAQQAYYKELGVAGESIINFGHWESSKKGLLSGEKLSLQLKQLDASYINNNIREYEITKHISLSLLDPLALLSLKNTSSCVFEIPEVLYDLDFPGHYFRRIKSVSISMPCIAGPFTSVSAKLSLEKHSLKIKAVDTTLKEVLGYTESIVTSGAQNDSGVFELNFRDERYVPFEGTGAISNWRLEFPSATKQFDFNTIADVVMHVKYTARDGGDALKNAANAYIKKWVKDITNDVNKTGLHIAINLKHDMPNEWHMLKKDGKVDMKIDKTRLPYMAQGIGAVEIEKVIFYAKAFISPSPFSVTPNLPLQIEPNLFSSVIDPGFGKVKIWEVHYTNIKIDKLFTIQGGTNKMPAIFTNEQLENLEELIMVVKYSF
jgi:Tc toxin complex TcA C-terminal TcB-binding domain/Neuraminidase-like domain